jgi:hypothetical protein
MGGFSLSARKGEGRIGGVISQAASQAASLAASSSHASAASFSLQKMPKVAVSRRVEGRR